MRDKLLLSIFIIALILGSLRFSKIGEASGGVLPPSPPELHWHELTMQDGSPGIAITMEEYHLMNSYVGELMRIIKVLNFKYINNSRACMCVQYDFVKMKCKKYKPKECNK